MDQDHLMDKIKRIAHVTSTMGSVATRFVAHSKTPFKTDNLEYAAVLTKTLSKMKGPFMKVAQFLATIPDALPQEYADAFMELQSQATPMGELFVQRRLKNEFGEHWKNNFKEFNLHASFAASLGQVHQAVLQNGHKVAVKLQYPNMKSVIDSDMLQLKFAIKAYHLFSSALDLDDVVKEVQDRLYEELNYNQEILNLKEYQLFFKDNPSVIIPETYESLSTDRLIVMDWIEGDHILNASPDLGKNQMDEFGKLLFNSWYLPFYSRGWLHGDPHPGNYYITPHNQLALLDFGCIRRFHVDFIDAVADLYQGLKCSNPSKIKDAYIRWGFNDVSTELMEHMTEWARLLFDPLLDNSIRPIQKRTGSHGWQIAQKVHKELDRLGGVKIPREFVFMDRAAVGIGSVLMRIGAEGNWHKIFEDILEKRNNTLSM
ncbi:MAG: ABC transporter ATP-binding protein [Candidatus Puniceispirillum sp.]|nr:ABC transporter ATP-binding protein [Candidatus Pelagibacter sp.]MBA4283342.1 ABC transporter ATP-binding protein [Candidatus Puniceispirillum sp.]